MVAGGRELIDTLWNVNTYKEIKEAGVQLELIDTLWNVNIPYVNPDDFGNVRINRYIMECKLAFLYQLMWNDGELIDTLWNVNSKVFDEQVGQNMN